jgi:hypothetical protein
MTVRFWQVKDHLKNSQLKILSVISSIQHHTPIKASIMASMALVSGFVL